MTSRLAAGAQAGRLRTSGHIQHLPAMAGMGLHVGWKPAHRNGLVVVLIPPQTAGKRSTVSLTDVPYPAQCAPMGHAGCWVTCGACIAHKRERGVQKRVLALPNGVEGALADMFCSLVSLGASLQLRHPESASLRFVQNPCLPNMLIIADQFTSPAFGVRQLGFCIDHTT